MKFGILGYGRFGKLWAHALAAYGEVLVYDQQAILETTPGMTVVDLAELGQADVIFILTPITHFAEACLSIKPYLQADTLIVDCCSIKVYPVSIMRQVFPASQALLATHPLFGPDSVLKTHGLRGHKMVICPLSADGDKIKKILDLFNSMGLNVIRTTPEEHDQQMANSQGLVHFIGRGLAALKIHQQELATPDYQALLNLNKMVVNDTWQLFMDMHQYNPYTKVIREQFINQLIKLNREIDNETNTPSIKEEDRPAR